MVKTQNEKQKDGLNRPFFEAAHNPRDASSSLFLREGPHPLHASVYADVSEFETEFLLGARAMGFTPTPQQWKIAAAIYAHDSEKDRPVNRTVGVCVPRRAGKTTALLALALGRCLARPGYVVLFTAQSGTKASARFLELARSLERVEPSDEARGFRILRGAGNQNLSFYNGSHFQVIPPKPDAFRGDAGDMILLDEAQEHDAAESAELMGAILPTMDTRLGAQLIVAGTAGERRSGLFWDTLEEGRAGQYRTGIIEFAAPDSTLEEDAEKPELWQAVHPGIGTLTDLETIENNFNRLPRPNFLREYLGIWPEDFSRSAIDMQVWRAAATAFAEKPAAFSLAFDVAVDGSTAAIAAAWRDGATAYVEILDHKQGTDWLVPRLRELAHRYRCVIGHDTVGAALVEAEALSRLRPRPRVAPLSYRDLSPGCARFMKDLLEGNLKHFDQPALNEAALKVVKRPLGENGWAWGRRQSGGDITPLVAATMALRTFDNMKPAQKMAIVSTKSA